MIISSPAINGSPACESTGEESTSCKLGKLNSFPDRPGLQLLVTHRAVAQLPTDVAAPAPRRTVVSQRAGVIGPGCQHGEAHFTRHRDGGGVYESSLDLQSTAKLTVAVAAPTPRDAVGSQCARVFASSCQRGE